MTEGAASHPTAPKPGALGTAKRRDLAALEERRIRAARLLREGVRPAEVARRVGVHRQSVSRWARKLKRGGERALGAGRVGRPAGLHGEDLRRVESQLKRGPGTLGYKKWTSARVKELIERQCRVKYDASQAWRILRRMGWSFHPSGPKPGPPGTPGFHPSGPKPGPPGTPGWRRGGGGWRKTQSSQNRA
jgi:transposase